MLNDSNVNVYVSKFRFWYLPVHYDPLLILTNLTRYTVYVNSFYKSGTFTVTFVGVITKKMYDLCPTDHHNFRLQGGSNVCSGQLEVEEDEGVWKPVCQSQYKLNKSSDDLCSHMLCGKSHSQENMVCDSSKNISLNCTGKAL